MNLKNTFKDDPQRASEAGKKSKRKSFDKRMREWMESPVVETIMQSAAGQEVLDKLGINSGSVEDTFRFALLMHGLKGNVPAIKESFNRAYGEAIKRINLKGRIKSVIADLSDLSEEQLIEIKKKQDEIKQIINASKNDVIIEQLPEASTVVIQEDNKINEPGT